ncbi:MAG: hypothetical protein MRY59_06430 [Aquisalinus sp.]|nr:hypothetical protein [Aquisalinus sp.]
MVLDFAKIARLVDLQYQQKEQSLQRIRQEQQRLRDLADACEQAVQQASPAADVSGAVALEKWVRAQQAKAEQLRQQAAGLDQVVIDLQTALRKDLKRVTGLEMMRARAEKEEALREEEREDDALLAVSSLSDLIRN